MCRRRHHRCAAYARLLPPRGRARPSLEFSHTLPLIQTPTHFAARFPRTRFAVRILRGFVRLFVCLALGLSSALGAADKVFLLMNRKAQLPPTGQLQPPSCEGRITLSDVTFRQGPAHVPGSHPRQHRGGVVTGSERLRHVWTSPGILPGLRRLSSRTSRSMCAQAKCWHWYRLALYRRVHLVAHTAASRRSIRTSEAPAMA